MSASSHASATITRIENEIKQTILSRKRKLSCLYLATCTPPTEPPLSESHHPPIDNNLASFLDQNDLQKGRYFSESTLPSRPVFNLRPPPFQPSLSDQTPDLPRSEAQITTGNLTSVETSSRRTSKSPKPSASPQHPAKNASTRTSPLVGSESPSKADFSPDGDSKDDADHDPPAQLARVDTNDHGVSRKSRPARLESPPYSPGTAAPDGDTSRMDDTPTSGRDGATSAVTPRREDLESSKANENLLHAQRHGSQDDEKLDSNKPETTMDGVHRKSSTSSAADHRSTNASRTNNFSPIMTPTEEDTGTLRTHHAHPSDESEQPQRTPSAVAPTDRDLSTTRASDAATLDTSGGSQPSDLTMDALKHISDSKVEKLARVQSKKQYTLALTRKGERLAKHSEEVLSMARQSPLSVEYYRPLVSREALNSHHGKDLKALLENRSKTVTTDEREVAQREEDARLVLSRISHLQSSGRWSLRQPKPAIEPELEETPWDALLSEAKWLRADFREERKTKHSIARILAGWCAEFVNSDVETRRALSIEPVVAKSAPSLIHNLSHNSSEAYQEATPAASVSFEIEPKRAPFLFLGNKACLDQELLEQIPLFGERPVAQVTEHALKQVERTRSRRIVNPLDQPDTDQDADEAQALIEFPAVDKSCTLFSDNGRNPLRRKINMGQPFKPPNRHYHPMPSQQFYELRSASQWSQSDDEKLRMLARSAPGNWSFIAQEMSTDSDFVTSSERRTPWECYERLYMLDSNLQDMSQRQLLKPFYQRQKASKERFEEGQRQLHAQIQQARDNGQQPPNVAPKLFPEPKRVERKTSRRFMAVLDAARRLARKRETAITRQERSQAEARPNQHPAPHVRVSHDPQWYAQKKYEQEKREHEKMAADIAHRKQQYQEVQRRAQHQYTTSLTNGIGQQMRNGMANNAPTANGHLAVPQMRYGRPNQQHPNMQANATNGVPSTAQLAVQGRPQMGGQGQRFMPQPGSQENISQLLQHQQAAQQRLQNGQLQSHPSQQQGQMQRAASNSLNGMPQTVMQSNNDRTAMGNGDLNSSPSLQQMSHHQHSKSNPSPHIQQALAAASGQRMPHVNGNHPQALSSGRVPDLVAMMHRAKQQNPGISDEEARRRATEHLTMLTRQSRESAISAASGQSLQVQGQPAGQAPQQHQQHQRPQPNMQMAGGSQSPYQQHAVPAPQMQSPYQQNGILASNQAPQHNGHMAHAYQASMRAKMYQQQQQQMQMHPQMSPASGGGAGMGASPSPHMSHPAYPPANNRTPGAGQMRPPSRSASGYEVPQYMQHEMQRPGSSAAQSPRPISAQGYGPPHS